MNSPLHDILKEKILVLDGAMGTFLQRLKLTAEDFGGKDLEGCNENLILTRPDVITHVHEEYFKAGADMVETDTFGSTPVVLAEYGLGDKAYEISKKGAELARAAAKKFATPAKPRFVAGSMGPTTKSLFVTGKITFDELVDNFAVQARGLIDGGADALLVETALDTLNVKAALIGIEKAAAETGKAVPVMVSATIETLGTMLAGQGVEALYYSLQQRDLLSIGLNCATGPDFMTDHVRTLSELSRFGVSCYPNAGLPDEMGKYNETPEMIAKKLERFIDHGWLNVVGGCCGTTEEHIRLIAQMAEGKKPRPYKKDSFRCSLSGLEPFVIEDDKRPVLVGERTNVIGSRKFKQLIVAENYEEASEIARKQVRSAAQIIDVCLANPDRDELTDIDKFMDLVTRKVKVPFMIDSTDAAVMESALKKCLGRSVLNSINLEDGEERFEKVAPLIRRYGAAVVVGCIDEDKQQGMAVTRQRKLAVAERSYKLLTEKYGLVAEDIIFDPLVFPAATGDKNYIGSARETIEGIRLIKQALPRTKTVLGISNVSFGLPEAGREVLNSVFLYHCVQAGLDLAIVNSEKLARYATIPEEEKKLAEALLFADPSTTEAAVAAFANHFRERASIKIVNNRASLPIDERLARNILEGSKEGLTEDLDTLLKDRKPLEIINGPLMKGMDEVGRLFNDNKLIVAEVLQSAEAMKTAVAHLEPFMDKADAVSRGKVILATVKGDVHDIGKNLVHIIFKNNGYYVIDLGIKVPPEDIIKAVREHNPDIVGLSGLLVKSAQQMVITAEDLKAAGVRMPILVGGAALTEKFTASKIAPTYEEAVLYAKDAMSGLDLANRLMDVEQRQVLLKKNAEIHERLRAAQSAAPAPAPASNGVSKVNRAYEPPVPPDLKLHVLQDFRVEDIFKYVNPVMLYGKHLGLRGKLDNLLANKNEKAMKLHADVTKLQDEIIAKKLIQPKAIWKFFPVQAEGNVLKILDSPSTKNVLATFDFPRQAGGDNLSLSDYVLPAASGKVDYVAMFVVTCGQDIMARANKYREEGEYFKSHALSVIAIESAEGFAELLHEKLRASWGFPDPSGMSFSEKFQAKYRGLRVSFGYPACPNLEDQTQLFQLLEPQKHIGVILTENFMMEPEATVSALVFHHPEAHYFSVGPATEAVS